MDPLAVHKEFVLVLSFREVQDSDKVVVAVQREETCHTITPVMLWMLPFRGVPEKSTLRAPARLQPLGARLADLPCVPREAVVSDAVCKDVWTTHLNLCWHCRMRAGSTTALPVESAVEINPCQIFAGVMPGVLHSVSRKNTDVSQSNKKITMAGRHVRDD